MVHGEPGERTTDTGYTPQGKPARSVLREYYARERGGRAR